MTALATAGCLCVREDEEALARLTALLASLRDAGHLEAWATCFADAGPGSADAGEAVLGEAAVIAALISPAALSSPTFRMHLDRAIQRHRSGDAVLLPIVLRPNVVQATFLHRLDLLPRGAKPITLWANPVEAWEQVAEDLGGVVRRPLLGRLYGRLAEEGRQAMRDGSVQVSPFLGEPERDGRLGLTLIVRPSEAVAREVERVIASLRAVDPRQFYYDRSRLHFTILSVVDAQDPSQVSLEKARACVGPIEEVLRGCAPFEVEFAGICATRGGLIAKGIPLTGALEALRDSLRARLTEAGLGARLDARYRLLGAHITIGRFRETTGLAPLARVLDELHGEALGSMRVEIAELVVNDFYMSAGKAHVVSQFHVGDAPARLEGPVARRPGRREARERPRVTRQHTPADVQAKPAEPELGLVTALPKEYAAVKAILENTRATWRSTGGRRRRYLLGQVASDCGGAHTVVLCLARKGNTEAALHASHLLGSFPSVKAIIMVGIAGGVPWPEKPADHVRLGDIVVSDRGGVVTYDVGVDGRPEFTVRLQPLPPSPELLEAARLLEAEAEEGKYPWEEVARAAMERLTVSRPPDDTDVLFSTVDPDRIVPHPEDPSRRPGQPRVHLGVIASANAVLKDPSKRDKLRDQFGIKAVEMEGSGVGEATWDQSKGYLVVRGICDYCDPRKNDAWQRHAAAVAAAYVRALLASMPVLGSEAAPFPAPEAPPSVSGASLSSVPAGPTFVIGRTAERKETLRRLTGTDARVVVLSGYGGIGKSTVAQQVARECMKREAPFEFVAWVDLRRYERGHVAPLSYLLDTLARAADRESEIPAIAHVRAKRDSVTSLLASRRALVVLDNYEDILSQPGGDEETCEFLQDLLAASPNTRILVTTREVSDHLREGLFIHELRLEKLSLEDSVTLMRSWAAGRHLAEEEYRRVWELLHGLPKYMQIAIAQLRRMDFRHWERMVERIRIPLDASDRFFTDLFGHSWERLSEPLRHILMALTHFVGTASPEPLQEVSGLPETRFALTLASAPDAYIESTEAGYVTHPLTHAFARAVLDSDQEAGFHRESGERFVGHFRRLAETSAAGGADAVEREIRNIGAAARLASRLGLCGDILALRVAVVGFLRFRGYWREVAEIVELAAEASRRLGDEHTLADCLVTDLAWHFLRLEELAQAEACAIEGMALYERTGDREGVAQALRHLGKAALVSGLDRWYEPTAQWPEYGSRAKDYYQRSLAIRMALVEEGRDQRLAIGDMELDFGRLYWLHGKAASGASGRPPVAAAISLARDWCRRANDVSWQAMDTLRAAGSERGVAKAWGNLGNATKEMAKLLIASGDTAAALRPVADAHEYYLKSAEIAARIGRRDELAHARWGLAEVYEIYADHPSLHAGAADVDALLEAARHYAEQSLETYAFLGGPRDINALTRLVVRLKSRLLP